MVPTVGSACAEPCTVWKAHRMDELLGPHNQIVDDILHDGDLDLARLFQDVR